MPPLSEITGSFLQHKTLVVDSGAIIPCGPDEGAAAQRKSMIFFDCIISGKLPRTDGRQWMAGGTYDGGGGREHRTRQRRCAGELPGRIGMAPRPAFRFITLGIFGNAAGHMTSMGQTGV